MIRLRLAFGVISLFVISSFCPIEVDAVVSTNVNFNTICLERRAAESSSPDDTTGYTKKQLARVEAIREANRFRNLPKETLAALGTESNEVSAPVQEDEPEPSKEPEEDTESSFHIGAEHVLLILLVLAVLGVVLFGKRKK